MTILLNYYEAEKIDLKEYYKMYDNPKTQYKLLQGAPLLVNVEGRYIKAYDIPELIVNRSQRALSAVNKWLGDLKSPPNVTIRETLEFKWKR